MSLLTMSFDEFKLMEFKRKEDYYMKCAYDRYCKDQMDLIPAYNWYIENNLRGDDE